MMDIDQFIHQQREAVDESRGRERNRDRDRRSDRERSRERRDRRDRSRRERRDNSGSRRNESRYRDRDCRDSDRNRDDRGYRNDRDYRDVDYRDNDRDSRDSDPLFEDGYPEDYHSYHSFSQQNDQNDSQSFDSKPYDRNYFNDNRHRSEKAADKWISDSPTHTILVKGLPQHVDEKDIRAELMMSNTPVREVRLVKDKQSGASRGFAFVEFQNISDAQQWMEHNQGELRLLNQYTVRLYFSTPKGMNSTDRTTPLPSHGHGQLAAGVIGDWICSKCGVHNFKRREHCFKCNISRDESERDKDSDGYDQVGLNQCNTLILRGLDALTSELSLKSALLKVSMLPLKNLHVIRDEHGVSKSYAFLEMDSIANSTQLLETISRLRFPLEVDGKAVMVNYAKNTFTTVMATLNPQYASQYSGADYAAYEKYYGADAYQQYCKDYFQQNGGAPVNQPGAGNATGPLAHAAIQQAHAANGLTTQENMQKQLVEQMQQQMTSEQRAPSTVVGAQADSTDCIRYPTPDVSTYQYEETSGYYYDPTTGLYYDASSQYYYNATTTEFMYWDGNRHTYVPAPSSDTQNIHKPDTDIKDKTEKKDKVKVAKKIAKDMAKWAKSLNAQKDSNTGKRSISINMQPRKESAAADAGFAMLEKLGKSELGKLSEAEPHAMPPPQVASGSGAAAAAAALVASYGGGDDSDGDDDDSVDDNKMVDYSKLACLLCKRQFASKEILQKHQQLSDLHKKNLEELRKSKAASKEAAQQMGDISGQTQYRDRAKERREKYGAPAPPEPRNKGRVKTEAVPFEQPTKQGLGSDNVGNKLLQKMGWNAGQGLGKSQQGIVDPLVASRRQQGAGLGAHGSRIMVDPEVTHDYRKAAKQQLFARYRELN